MICLQTCKVSNSSNITESERVPPVHDNLGTSFKQIASRENLTKLLSNKIVNQEEAQMICRVCLTASTPFISLFAKFEGQYVAYMLTFCTSLNVSELCFLNSNYYMLL